MRSTAISARPRIAPRSATTDPEVLGDEARTGASSTNDARHSGRNRPRTSPQTRSDARAKHAADLRAQHLAQSAHARVDAPLVDAAKTALVGVGSVIGNVVTGVAGLFGAKPRSDLGTDGTKHRVDVPDAPGQPIDRDRPPILFVNGAGGHLEAAEETARIVGQAAGREVELVHNATEIRQYDNPGLQLAATLADFPKDVHQLIDDMNGRGTNPAVDTVRDEVLDAMRDGRRLDVAGHSQGTTIMARALRDARDIRHAELMQALGDEALVREQLERELGNIRALNISGPVRYDLHFPPEMPRASYAHVELPGDPAAEGLGELAAPYAPDDYQRRVWPGVFDLPAGGRAHAAVNVVNDPENNATMRALFGE